MALPRRDDLPADLAAAPLDRSNRLAAVTHREDLVGGDARGFGGQLTTLDAGTEVDRPAVVTEHRVDADSSGLRASALPADDSVRRHGYPDTALTDKSTGGRYRNWHTSTVFDGQMCTSWIAPMTTVCLEWGPRRQSYTTPYTPPSTWWVGWQVTPGATGACR